MMTAFQCKLQCSIAGPPGKNFKGMRTSAYNYINLLSVLWFSNPLVRREDRIKGTRINKVAFLGKGGAQGEAWGVLCSPFSCPHSLDTTQKKHTFCHSAVDAGSDTFWLSCFLSAISSEIDLNNAFC